MDCTLTFWSWVLPVFVICIALIVFFSCDGKDFLVKRDSKINIGEDTCNLHCLEAVAGFHFMV